MSNDRTESAAHVPVMPEETINGLNIKPGGVYCDCTLGAGGHSEAILRNLAGGRLIAIDRDPRAIAIATARLAPIGGVIAVRGNFGDLAEIWRREGFPPCDGFLFDLGVSSMQLDTAGSGFSFTSDGPLDMRFDPQDGGESAADIVNYADEDDLSDLFWRFGETSARRVAAAIAEARRKQSFATTAQLAEFVSRVRGTKGVKPGRHPATKVFLALRAAVNGEMQAVETGIPAAMDILAPGGRIVVISYHSAEDTIVKYIFKKAAKGCSCDLSPDQCQCQGAPSIILINKKVITPRREEVLSNRRARSAKIRIVERI